MPSYDKKIIIERYPNGLFSLWVISDEDDCIRESCGETEVEEVLAKVKEELEEEKS